MQYPKAEPNVSSSTSETGIPRSALTRRLWWGGVVHLGRTPIEIRDYLIVDRREEERWREALADLASQSWALLCRAVVVCQNGDRGVELQEAGEARWLTRHRHRSGSVSVEAG